MNYVLHVLDYSLQVLRVKTGVTVDLVEFGAPLLELGDLGLLQIRGLLRGSRLR